MKADLIKKMDEYVLHLINKPNLTPEEYMVLDRKLGEIRFLEGEAARKLEMAESERRLKMLTEIIVNRPGGDPNALQ